MDKRDQGPPPLIKPPRPLLTVCQSWTGKGAGPRLAIEGRNLDKCDYQL